MTLKCRVIREDSHDLTENGAVETMTYIVVWARGRIFWWSPGRRSICCINYTVKQEKGLLFEKPWAAVLENAFV